MDVTHVTLVDYPYPPCTDAQIPRLEVAAAWLGKFDVLAPFRAKREVVPLVA